MSKGGAMYHWMDGWGWFWMTFMMFFWIVVLGAVVYAAVKLANRPPSEPRSHA
jgi:heme/copper-type cytochrome/quinol oxidase subunit 2